MTPFIISKIGNALKIKKQIVGINRKRSTVFTLSLSVFISSVQFIRMYYPAINYIWYPHTKLNTNVFGEINETNIINIDPVQQNCYP